MASIIDRALIFKDHRARGRHRRRAPEPMSGGFREFMSDSLLRNSAFLALSTAFGAACGYAALSLLTRLYSVQAIGLAAAALSASGFVSTLTQFGANYTLPRFLPTSRYRNALINTVLTVTMLAAFLGATVFLTLPAARQLYALGGVIFGVIFILYTGINAAESQLENVFIADRASYKMTRAAIIGNVVKLAAPAACIVLGMSGAFIAQCLTGVASFVVLAVLLVRRGDRLRPMFSIAATRDLRRYSVGAYIGSQVGALPVMILPLIILLRLGPNSNAYWYTSMAIAALLYQLPGCVARALLAEAAHRPAERAALMRRSATVIGAVMTPVLIIAYFMAPLALAVLGHRYAAGSLVPLRWLIIGGIMSSVNYVTGTILYIAKKTFIVTIINAIDAVVVLGLAATVAHNCTEVAICWVIGEIFNVVLFAIYALRSLYQVHGRWEALGGENAVA